ncbi:hypothetical protein CRENBAI_001648 [Crenichthys baileyi]|uniref:Uncharacterized protein n=1 Tax=Crenichthys baileyi TaxID=28760 RepID=A0AAV9SN96_9TELE
MGCRAASLGQIGQSVAECAERQNVLSEPNFFLLAVSSRQRPTDTGSTFSRLYDPPNGLNGPMIETLRESVSPDSPNVEEIKVSPRESLILPQGRCLIPGYTRPDTPLGSTPGSKFSIDFCLTVSPF